MPAVQMSGDVEYNISRIGCALHHNVREFVAFYVSEPTEVINGKECFSFILEVQDPQLRKIKVRAFNGDWLAFINSVRYGVVFQTFENKQDVVEWLLQLDSDITLKSYRRAYDEHID